MCRFRLETMQHANSYSDTGLKNLVDTKDSIIQETLYRSAYGWTDTATGKSYSPSEYWAMVVEHESFQRESDEFDKLSWNLLDDCGQPNTVVCNHRGDGKTTRTSAFITRAICLRLTPSILYLQATAEDAATEMDNVKSQLMQNEFITEVFGNMKATSFGEVTKTFGKRAWFACEPNHKSVPKDRQGEPFCFILPRGAGQRVRGRNIYIHGKRVRPHYVFADDLEDDEAVLSAENRSKLKGWFFGSVMRVVRQDQFPNATDYRWKIPKDAHYTWQPPYRVFFNGTLLHHDALIANLLDATDWKSVRIPLGKAEEVNGEVVYTSLRPSRITSEQLTSQAVAAKQMKTLDSFYREILCQPTSRENACWTKDMLQYMTLERDAELQEDPNVVRFIIVDPSKSASQQADLTGIIAVAISPKLGSIYIRRAVGLHLNSADIPARAIKMAVETNSSMVFVEIIGQHGVTDINFTNEVTKRGLPIQLMWLNQGHTPRGDYGTGNDAIKRWRAQQILPYYQQKEVFHALSLKGETMEQHMLDYPSPTDWCFLDCAGYIPAVMHILGLHFGQQVKYDNIARFQPNKANARMDDDIKNRRWATV